MKKAAAKTLSQRLDFFVDMPKIPDFMRFSDKRIMTTICIKIVVIIWCAIRDSNPGHPD